MPFNPQTFNINDDPRFQKNLDTKFVDLLDKHGFEVIEEQPKDIHKLGLALGQEANEYIEYAKQLYIESKLAIAIGSDLDNFGLQFGVARNPGEDDENYRKRLQAVFSPKKVTRPHINLVLSQFTDIIPPPELFEPWRSVMHYDILFPYDWRYDVGPWYMWSPDYWRSGVLVVKSGLSNNIYGVVEEMVNAGIIVWYEQTGADVVDPDDILPPTIGYQEDTISLGTRLFTRFFYDIITEGAFDDPLSRYDVGDINGFASYQDDTNYSISYIRMGMPDNTLNEAVWDIAVWDESVWPFEGGIRGTTSYQIEEINQVEYLETVFNTIPGDYLVISSSDNFNDNLTISDSVVNTVFYSETINETLTLTEVPEYVDYLLDGQTILGDGVSLVNLPVIDLSNPDDTELEDFSIE